VLTHTLKRTSASPRSPMSPNSSSPVDAGRRGRPHSPSTGSSSETRWPAKRASAAGLRAGRWTAAHLYGRSMATALTHSGCCVHHVDGDPPLMQIQATHDRDHGLLGRLPPSSLPVGPVLLGVERRATCHVSRIQRPCPITDCERSGLRRRISRSASVARARRDDGSNNGRNRNPVIEGTPVSAANRNSSPHQSDFLPLRREQMCQYPGRFSSSVKSPLARLGTQARPVRQPQARRRPSAHLGAGALGGRIEPGGFR
jgi:hypothetical protein